MSMDPAAIARAKEVLSCFSVTNVPYQTIGDHKVTLAVLIPNDLKPGKHPFVVRFHGFLGM